MKVDCRRTLLVLYDPPKILKSEKRYFLDIGNRECNTDYVVNCIFNDAVEHGSEKRRRL